jgi:ATP-dependent Clp protease ATP-binding subunit ClpA
LTVEHLLLAILEAPTVQKILCACRADVPKLEEELKEHIDQTTPRLEESEDREVQPTLGFQRVLQRAVFHVQTRGEKDVGVANVLVAMFSEKQSHAVFLLNRQHVSVGPVTNCSRAFMAKPRANTDCTCPGLNARHPGRFLASNDGQRETWQFASDNHQEAS